VGNIIQFPIEVNFVSIPYVSNFQFLFFFYSFFPFLYDTNQVRSFISLHKRNNIQTSNNFQFSVFNLQSPMSNHVSFSFIIEEKKAVSRNTYIAKAECPQILFYFVTISTSSFFEVKAIHPIPEQRPNFYFSFDNPTSTLLGLNFKSFAISQFPIGEVTPPLKSRILRSPRNWRQKKGTNGKPIHVKKV